MNEWRVWGPTCDMNKRWALFVAVLILPAPACGASLVSGGGFEVPVIPDPGVEGEPGFDWVAFLPQYRVAGTPWLFEGDSGITALPRTWEGWAHNAPEGNKVAVIQDYFGLEPEGHFSQTFGVPAAGLYQLTFLDAGRYLGGGSAGNVQYEVRIDAVPVGLFATTSGQPFVQHSLSFWLAPGDHCLSFDVRRDLMDGQDNMAFIDNVTLDPVVIEVAIDIKPGSSPNSINLGSNGTVPVAIFGSATFDAATVNPTSVTLADAAVKLKGKGTPMASLEDVNGDGFKDLLVHVLTSGLQLTATDTRAILRGQTKDGTPTQGSDTVRVVPQ